MKDVDSSSGNLPPGDKKGEVPPWVSRELAGTDRGILVIIFLEQFFLSISLFWVAGMMPYKSGLYSLVVFFGFWGLVSAFCLGFTGPVSRVFALLWHLTFVGWISVSHISEGSSARALNARQWASYDSLSILYLAATAFLQYRNRQKAGDYVESSNEQDR